MVEPVNSRFLRTIPFMLIVTIFWVWLLSQTSTAWSLSLRKPQVRSSLVIALAQESHARKGLAEYWASVNAVPIFFEVDGVAYELMYLENDTPVYYRTLNANAAISIGTDIVQDTESYGLSGAGITIGLWDEDSPLLTHQEFQASPERITIKDIYQPGNHATQAAGTLCAVGIKPAAKGMAPLAKIEAWDWDNDVSEMALCAASYPGEPNKIYVSNHSYGLALGWEDVNLSGHRGWHWMGKLRAKSSPILGTEYTLYEDRFGSYEQVARDYDTVAHAAPYYLIFVAAGNDRDDNPSPQEYVYISTDGYKTWNRVMFIIRVLNYSMSGAQGDGISGSEYGTIHPSGVAKNVVTVGAITDASSDGQRDLSKAQMTTFSSWGPTDSGRLKPDVVAKGENLYTASASSDFSYSQVNGTSSACPSVSGSAALLIEHFTRLFPEQAMRASTLKGLILHSADDLGNVGPDYKFGWGLVNTEAAIALITEHDYREAEGNILTEDVLSDANAIHIYHVESDGTQPLHITLCWTDPPGLRLIHDLDLRVEGPNDVSILYPYVLDPARQSAAAITGDNSYDNVEQIHITAPQKGIYTICVVNMYSLSEGEQWYSLITSQPARRDTNTSNRLLWPRRHGAGPDGDIIFDEADNIYLTGDTWNDVFIGKYDIEGHLLWDKQFGTDYQDFGRAIAVDNSGNIYCAGYTWGSLAETRIGDGDAFISKYDASGNDLWILQFGTDQKDDSSGIASDNSGNAYVTGYTRGSLHQDNLGGKDIFIHKYDTSGTLLWGKQFGTEHDDESTCITVDISGNIYCAGYTGGSLADALVGWNDAFISKYDAMGNLLWAVQFGTTRSDSCTDIAVDSSDCVYVAGITGGSLDAEKIGGSDVFIRKYDTDGRLLWGKQFGTTSDEENASISVDLLGNIYIAGETEGSLGGINAGSSDVFVCKYDPTANLAWSRQLGTWDRNSCGGISADARGDVYIALSKFIWKYDASGRDLFFD